MICDRRTVDAVVSHAVVARARIICMLIAAVRSLHRRLILSRETRAGLQAEIGRIRAGGVVLAVCVVRVAVRIENHDAAGLERVRNVVDRRIVALIDRAHAAGRLRDGSALVPVLAGEACILTVIRSEHRNVQTIGVLILC